VSNDSQNDLDTFLAALPVYQRKQFEPGLSSLTQNEMLQWIEWLATAPEQAATLQHEYMRLLQRVPVRLREYRKRERRENDRRFTALYLPKIPEGRPRKDTLASEAAQLKKAGLSHAQIALRLNPKYGTKECPLTKETLRGLLKARRRESLKTALPPEKAQS
jgi:hypothetical protein